MAKTFDGTNITTGFDIRAAHVSQSIDAFTGAEAYDVKLSGSLIVTGSSSTPAIDVEGAIKATSYISSSTFIASNGDFVGGRLVIGQQTPGLSPTGSAWVTDLYVANEISNASGNGPKIKALNITASGGISSSGDFHSENMFVGNVGSQGVDNDISLFTQKGIVALGGNIHCVAGNLGVTTTHITASGNVKIAGNINIGGDLTFAGNITSPLGDLSAASISSSTNITALGNITSGGTISGNVISVAGGDIYSAASTLNLKRDHSIILGDSNTGNPSGLPINYNTSISQNSLNNLFSLQNWSLGGIKIEAVNSDLELKTNTIGKKIQFLCDNAYGQSGPVLISGSSTNTGLDVRGNIDSTGIISGSSLSLAGGTILSSNSGLTSGNTLQFTDNNNLYFGSGANNPGGIVTTFNTSIAHNASNKKTTIQNWSENGLDIETVSGDLELRTQEDNKIIFNCGNAFAQSGPVTIKGSSTNTGLDVQGTITSSGDIFTTAGITGSRLQTTSQANIGGGLTVGGNINMGSFNTDLILGRNSEIKRIAVVGASIPVYNDFLVQTNSNLLQLHVNGGYGTNSSTTTHTTLYSNGLNGQSGLDLRYKPENVQTASISFRHFANGGTDTFTGIFEYQTIPDAPQTGLSDNCAAMFWSMQSGNSSETDANGGGVFNYGNGKESRQFQLYFDGSTKVESGFGAKLNGNFGIALGSDRAYKTTANSWSATSDSRLKENIVTASIDTCYNNVKNLPLKYYKWKEEVQQSPVDDTHMLGWIAQDVEAILPNAVQKSDFTTWSTFTGSEAITGSYPDVILEPGKRYQDRLAGSEVIGDRQTLQPDQIIKMMYGAIQKLQEKVEALELQISGSNS